VRALASLGVIAVASLAIGGASLAVGRAALRPDLSIVLLELRLFRTAAAFGAGAALAVAGTLAQGLFRNPLADASVLGTSTGAILGGQLALLALTMIGASAPIPPELVLPVGTLTGGAIATLAVVSLTPRDEGTLGLVLVGFVASTVLTGLSTTLTSVAQESYELSRALTAFSLGGVSTVGPAQLAMAAPLVLFGLVAAMRVAPSLDVLLSGEREASSLGVQIRRVRRYGVAWLSVLVAAAVSVGASAPFVGLVVPHALRRWLGEAHGLLLLASFFAGGAFLVLCDVVVRLIPTESELPLGVVTSFLGAPVFVLLLRARAKEA
jgi:iron complex transport system permease protein